MPVAQPTTAIVLRTVRYGEADLIAHLFSREHGRRNVIAKGVRRQKSRLRTRLEPFTVIDVMLRRGRGELEMVESIEVWAAHDQLRGRYAAQQLAAVAFDLLNRLSVEDAANEAAFHLTTRLLALLDADDAPDTGRLPLLLAAYELKLLHLSGIAPQLQSCTRCGREESLEAFSPPDGGVVCDDCRTAGDTALDPAIRGVAAWAMQRPLAEAVTADEVPEAVDAAAVMRRIVEPMCTEHAGFRPRPLELHVR